MQPDQSQQFLQRPSHGTAVPLASLSKSSVPIDCPNCRVRAVTAMSYQSGNHTHMWAVVFTFLLLAPCIPYLVKSFKDVQHTCGNCGVPVAVWRQSGGVEILIH
ncbi:LITAF-like zinc ribbon domain-containing protein [Trichophaea hybrida]|nr:LITAF-like zinc ribbon domain-containing protein [Trichophaea hybrida]